MKHSSIYTFIFLLGMVLFSIGCGDDIPPNTSVIKGTITVDNIDVWETWVDSGEVQLTIFPAFSLNPPSGWGEVPDGTFGPNVPGGTFALGAPFNSQNPIVLTYESGKTEYDYELEVDPGTYSALALGFRHDNVQDQTKKTATLGVHHDNPDVVSHGVVIKVVTPGGIIPVFNFPPPVTFTVVDGEEYTINFKADFGFVNDWYQ
ncbi:MAG: hypothetical protein HKN67_03120 [Saprospiraceae bacterium]|nr:hypothetical protein [Bacteroidia bacterium]MBT8229975.1 hypothetical protein [Bacteroidia bacterium]NNF20907.1 hypothetical protein [Saprospiraceae bacterium]NNK89946.1 hypothetical protein [Saprospiraceae bacterium]